LGGRKKKRKGRKLKHAKLCATKGVSAIEKKSQSAEARSMVIRGKAKDRQKTSKSKKDGNNIETKSAGSSSNSGVELGGYFVELIPLLPQSAVFLGRKQVTRAQGNCPQRGATPDDNATRGKKPRKAPAAVGGQRIWESSGEKNEKPAGQ